MTSDNEPNFFSLEQLGFSQSNRERLQSALKKQHGMIVVTGPVDSGKTTTLYSALSTIAKPGIKTFSTEYPVEHDLPHVEQVEVNSENNMTYPDAIKSFIRFAPHNIFIDELRDLKTISVAAQASMTGHLVLSSFHATSSAEVPVRLTDAGVNPFMTSNALSAVVAQRLIRRLCDTCKEEYYPETDELLAAGFAINGKKWEEGDEIPMLYKSHEGGCEECSGKGYQGRIAVHEVLLVDEAVSAQISNRADVSVIEETAIENGMTKIVDDGWAKVLNGNLSIEDVLRYLA